MGKASHAMGWHPTLRGGGRDSLGPAANRQSCLMGPAYPYVVTPAVLPHPSFHDGWSLNHSTNRSTPSSNPV